MNESELRPKVFITNLIRPGDVVLTTTPEAASAIIRGVTGADISHAMICVADSSVIDSTSDGVHARNLRRIVLEPGCAGHVLRPVRQLTTEQLQSVVSFARAAVGTRYTIAGAVKSVMAGVVPGRRQFCSRLVAQAYRSAGLDLVTDADFCHPGELLSSLALAEVRSVLRNLSEEEETEWRDDFDNVQFMRKATNELLLAARKLSTDIESLNDINAYLEEHPEGDAHLVQALHDSRYLVLWRDEFERNAWQYYVALMEGHPGTEERKRAYCLDLLHDHVSSQNRFVVNHAGYVTLHAKHPRQYFAYQIELYEALAAFHARRLKAAAAWLERRGVLESEPAERLRPHTAEWFASLREWNPVQAAKVKMVTQIAGSMEVCSVCGDDPVRDYELVHYSPAGPGTIRLCDDCFRIRSSDEPMKPF
ncbi:MAG: YiiX/YebB-like N1pC/P60 family cysteine hydrolase [Janthinobacterium lividum]